MELKEFITQTLININQGIIDAQEQTKESGIVINPKNIKKRDSNIFEVCNGNSAPIQEIEFNIVVNVTEGKDSKIAVGAFTGMLSGGVSNTNQNNSSTQTTIKFNLPVQFPSNDLLKKFDSVVF
ncbi:hypothetical protein [Flavobacterium sp. GSP14]|uniref:hypothetical protein n=1 Tax=Flavobacterium sp. GSP14 TaxID=3401734 RepID=UPI003AAAADCC